VELEAETDTRTTSCTDERKRRTMMDMRVRATVVGNTLVLEDGVTLPKEGTAVDIVMLDADTEKWTLTDKGWAQLREASDAIDKGHFVTDEELQAELDAIDAE